MTRKDYIAVAAKIKAQAPATGQPAFAVVPSPHPSEAFVQGAENMRRLLAIDLADIFAADNPRFKRSLFMTACGF